MGDRENVIVTAELTDLGADGRVTASAEGSPAALAELVDELVAELLSLGAGEYPESVAQLTSTSPEALEAYLLGREAWRAGRYHQAVDDFDRALSMDSTFALAAIARADGANMATGRGTGGAMEIAWEHRERLGPRDRMYLETRRPAEPRTRRERIEDYERLTRELPERVEAWYWLGEELIHYRNDGDPEWPRPARVAFERALELDPSYFPALQHIWMTEFLLPVEGRDIQEARALLARFRELAPQYVFMRLNDDARLALDTGALAAMEDPNDVIFAPSLPLMASDWAPEEYGPFVEAALRERHRRVGTDPSLSRASALLQEYRLRAWMGQRAEAAEALSAYLTEVGINPVDSRILDGVHYEGVLTETAAGAVARTEARWAETPTADLRLGDVVDALEVETWRLLREPEYVVSESVIERMRAVIGFEPYPRDLAVEGHAVLLEAWNAVRRGAPEAPDLLERFHEILREGPHSTIYAGRALLLKLSTIYEEAGDLERARDALERRTFATTSFSPYEAEFVRRSARLSAEVGDTARAIEEYRRYLHFRRYADEFVMPEVEAVRAELERLERAGSG